MLDILGREVNVGDIIVYGSKNRCSQFLSYAETKFGIVLSIIPKGKKYKLKANQTSTGQPVDCETFVDKATFHDLDKAGMISSTCARWKNGRPKIGNPVLISTCLKINVEELSDRLQIAHALFKQEFKI